MPESIEELAICHACGATMDVAEVAPFTKVVCPGCGEESRVKCEFGPYTLVRRHAVGGMSMVFAAEDHTLHREVAVKILSENYSANETRIAAFEEEARITASFNHPNVVRVLRTGRAFGRFYIAMELVPGGHFEHQIRERGKIPELELLPLAIEVAHGLQAAHAAGLIHRDVKPGNILLDATGHAKLVDFGLALVTQGGKAQATEVWATPYYVPPETVEGAVEDFRSDIYAFGATLYHALCGLPSCGEETMATDKLRDAKKRVLPLRLRDPSISPAVSQVVERAMAHNPDARFQSYDELIEALNAAWAQLRSGRNEPLDATALRRAGKKRKLRIAALAALLVVAVGGGAAVWWRQSRPAPAPPPVVEVVTKPPVVEVDTSGAIMKSYREARAAVVAKDFKKASEEFLSLHQNPAVHEPTRSWAGVEAVLASFLDGHPPVARQQAAITLEHLRTLPEANNPFGTELLETLGQLEQLPPLTPPTLPTPVASASSVLATMLAGLKNWEQGMMDRAAACFSAANTAKLSQDEQWAAIYQNIASDYLVDYQLLSSALFGKRPASKADCEAAIQQLEEALPKLKTHGRARFNVRAWQLDLAKQAKRMELSVAP